MTAWPASPDAPTLAAMQDVTSARSDLEWALSDPKPNAKEIVKAEEAYGPLRTPTPRRAEPQRELEAG